MRNGTHIPVSFTRRLVDHLLSRSETNIGVCTFSKQDSFVQYNHVNWQCGSFMARSSDWRVPKASALLGMSAFSADEAQKTLKIVTTSTFAEFETSRSI